MILMIIGQERGRKRERGKKRGRVRERGREGGRERERERERGASPLSAEKYETSGEKSTQFVNRGMSYIPIQRWNNLLRVSGYHSFYLVRSHRVDLTNIMDKHSSTGIIEGSSGITSQTTVTNNFVQNTKVFLF